MTACPSLLPRKPRTSTLTKSQIFLALSKEVPVDGKWVANPYKNWSDVDKSLPAMVEQVPDLIILDWMLPGLSGLELLRRWRSGRNTRGIPIIILTARGEETDRIRGLAIGADDYIVKPFSVPELMARARAILRRASSEKLSDTLMVILFSIVKRIG